MDETKRTRVIVGMSGGVDSSAAAALLLEQGYDVVGITLKLWPQDCVSRAEDKCCGPQAVTDARSVSHKLGIPYYLHSQAKSENDAKGVLNLGQYYLHSQVDPKNGPFKSEAERDQQALQTFQRIVTDYSGTKTASLSRYYVAKCQLSLGQFSQAYTSFDASNQDLKGTPLGDEAYLGKIMCLEAQNQWAPAATLSETFLKDHSDSFIAPEIRLALAAIYLQLQNKEKAAEQLNLTIKTYPDTPWSKEAARRLSQLKA